MECLIITGMSGAGKSLAADVLEDMGYYCVDNMPIPLIDRFIELFGDNSGKYERVAFVVDARAGTDFKKIADIRSEMNERHIPNRVLFLDCTDEEVINRHKATRRRHPLVSDGVSVSRAVAEERALTQPVKEGAEYVIDTTNFTTAVLKEQLIGIFGDLANASILINVNSFGYKYGLPRDSDLVFDARLLKNPFYVEELRPKCGLDEDVMAYVFADPIAEKYLSLALEMIELSVPRFIAEGRTSLVISVGCTGGHHRSVAVVERLSRELKSKGFTVCVNHRDVEKENEQ